MTVQELITALETVDKKSVPVRIGDVTGLLWYTEESISVSDKEVVIHVVRGS